MTIGEFAKVSRLSLKALRLYDALGLLAPARVNPVSNYRYYSESQLERAKLISLLRQLDMPLNRIAEVLELSGAAAVREVGRYWTEVEAEVSVKRKLVRYLENYLEGKGETMFDVQTRDVPEQKVLTLQKNVYVKDLPGFIDRSHRSLYAYIAQSGASAGDTSFVVYHGEVNEDSDGPVEVCVPFEGSLEPAGEMRLRLEPAHQEAYTRLMKAQVEFPGILEAYDAVHAWLAQNGEESSASPREVYFIAWDAAGPDDPACDIAFPFE